MEESGVTVKTVSFLSNKEPAEAREPELLGN